MAGQSNNEAASGECALASSDDRVSSFASFGIGAEDGIVGPACPCFDSNREWCRVTRCLPLAPLLRFCLVRSVSILAWTGPRGWLATHVSHQQVGSPSGSLAFQNPLPSSWGWQEPDQRFESHTKSLFSDKRASPKGALWPFSLTSPHVLPFSVCFCSFLLIHSSLLHRFRSSN